MKSKHTKAFHSMVHEKSQGFQNKWNIRQASFLWFIYITAADH